MHAAIKGHFFFCILTFSLKIVYNRVKITLVLYLYAQKGMAINMAENKNKPFLQMLKFTLFSISAGIIQIASFTLLNELAHLRYWPAYLMSLILSIVWNFTLNRRYTFKSAANIPIAMSKLFVFYLMFTPLSTWLGHIAESAGTNDYIILIITMLSNFVLEFLFSKFFIYRNQENTRTVKKL